MSVSPTPVWADSSKALELATNNVLDGKVGIKQALDQAAETAQTALDTLKLES